MKFKLIPTMAMLAMAIALPAQSMTKTEYKAAGQILDGDRKAAITACSASSGNAKSVLVIDCAGIAMAIASIAIVGINLNFMGVSF